MRSSGVPFAAVAVLLVCGAARLVYIEASQGEELRRRAIRQQTVTRRFAALRGEILDTRGRVLAGTVWRPSLFVDPKLVDDSHYVASTVAPIVGCSAAELERLLPEWQAEGRRFVWLARQVSDAQAEVLRREIALKDRLSALGIKYEPKRVYPQTWKPSEQKPARPLAAHLLGFVGVDLRSAGDDAYEDLRGRTGIEAEYDRLLAGQPGKRTVTVDLARRRVRSRRGDFEPAVDGATIVLTIDAHIQQIAQEALYAAYQKHAPEWAVAVVLDPQLGEVLAMATLPDFDLEDPQPPGLEQMSPRQREQAQALWRNRPVTDAYEPGSVFKPFIAAPAFDEGLIGIDEVLPIKGGVQYFNGRPLRDAHAHGPLPLHAVVSKSSNIGMALVGERCGNANLHRYVRLMGFGDVTGIGLPGEHAGLVNAFENWTSYSTQSIPIGQEVSATALQVASAFSVFCNGGVLLRPRIVRGMIGPDGQTLLDNSRPIPLRRVLDEDSAEVFRQRALVETVRSGTGKNAVLDDYQVFGKTGTAQIAGPHGYLGGRNARYTGSFVGGAPSDHPRVVVLVSIYKPTKEGYYGGTVAAPTVKEILGRTLAYMQVPPELPDSGVDDGRTSARARP